MRSGQSSGSTNNDQNLPGGQCYGAMHNSSLLTSFSNSLKPALYCLTQASNKYNSQLSNVFIGILSKYNKRNINDWEPENRILVRFSRIQSSMSQIGVVVYIRLIPHSQVSLF